MFADLLGEQNINALEILSADDPLEKGRIDKLSFRLKYGDVLAEGHYDRASQEQHKEVLLDFENNKTIVWRDNAVIENGVADIISPHDALGAMIKAVLEDRVDYQKNNALALQTLMILSKINKII